MKNIYILILLIIFLTPVFAQEMGKPLMRIYSIDEYQGSPQNWAVIQDDRGVMYFANNEGIIEYDGFEWRKIIVPNTLAIRSFAKDSCGRIYVGAVDEFGYIAPDKSGDMKYFSLSKDLDTAYQSFNNIWQTIYTTEGIFFCSHDILFRYNYHNCKKQDSLYSKNAITIWEPGDRFFRVFFVNNKLYVRDTKFGLKYVQNDSLIFVNNSEVFIDENLFGGLTKLDNDKWLTFSYHKGLQIFNSKENCSPDSILFEYKTDISSFLKEQYVYNTTQLPNGNYVFGTVNGGILIANNKFEPIYLIDVRLGIKSNFCYHSYFCNGILWLATDDGIISVELDSPFQSWEEELGVEKTVYDVIRFKERLYIATTEGVYYLDTLKFENSFSQNLFHKIDGLDEVCWSFSKVETVDNNKKVQNLFVGTSAGIYEIENNEIVNNFSINYIMKTYNSKILPNLLFIGSNEDFTYIYKDKKTNKWKENDNFINIKTDEIRTICIDRDSNIWFSDYKFLYKLKPNYIKDKNSNLLFNDYLSLKKYDTITGPSNLTYLEIYNYNNKDTSLLFFATENGLYTYNKKTNTFALDNFFDPILNSKEYKSVMFFSQDFFGNAFFDGKSKFLRQNNNSFSMDTLAYKRVFNAFYNTTYDEFAKKEWLCGVRFLMSHNVNYKRDYNQKYSPLIRKVVINSDSIIFNGTFYIIDTNSNNFFPVKNQLKHQKPIIDYNNNSITFSFATSYYEKTEAVVHSFKLDNFDKKWSDWTDKKEKEYTNLHEGKYIFKVKAKNVYGIESEIATYEFKILPPWYRTWWAYIIYVISLIILIIIIVKLSLRRVVKAKIKLEKIVKERTSEILQQKEEIETQAEELIDKNERLYQKNFEIETQRDEIEIQKNEIQKSHNQVTASINYAQRIQVAMLPFTQEFESSFSEYFILFKPRNIVSGDFYYFKKINNYIIFAVADCTGHGVPGAFVSMLGISLLNEITQNKETTKANQVLNKLRDNIKRSLRQTGKIREAKDGMDISLCVLNKSTNELQFAGAYNPLYIVKNKEYRRERSQKPSLTILKADRQPIGIHVKEKPFENIVFQLEKNDILYLFTDGFPDQPNEIYGKKYMIKNFKKLLLSNSDKQLNEQKQIFETELDNWQGKEKQRDDITVVGIKL